MIALGRLATVSAVSLAMLGLAAQPVAAAQLPLASHAAATVVPAGPLAYDSEASTVQGWRYPRYRRHSGAHLRTGDAIAGIAILGAVAAIASAASNAESTRTRTREVYREPPRERDGWRYSDNRQDDWGRGGINSAVNLCVSQVERGETRVDTVDNAARDGSGWRVQGSLTDGSGFSCRMDNEGRIRAIDIGDGYAAAAPADGQWDDEAYRSARANTVTPIDGKPTDQPQPAYPGGPLPGEDLGEGVDADLLGG